MFGLNKSLCLLAALGCIVAATGASGEETTGVETVPPSSVKHLPSDSPVAIEKECVGADGASVCWLKFTDGTRCVVANNAGGGDSAINCHFSTPLERLHRMPKD